MCRLHPTVNKLIVNSGYKRSPYISYNAYQKVQNNQSKKVDPREFHTDPTLVITSENTNTGEKHYGPKPDYFFPNSIIY